MIVLKVLSFLKLKLRYKEKCLKKLKNIIFRKEKKKLVSSVVNDQVFDVSCVDDIPRR